jgi:hypothetical protein
VLANARAVINTAGLDPACAGKGEGERRARERGRVDAMRGKGRGWTTYAGKSGVRVPHPRDPRERSEVAHRGEEGGERSELLYREGLAREECGA